MLVVSNTTPIISFAKVKRLDILKSLFGEVFISEGVYNELHAKPIYKEEVNYIDSCSFIRRKKVSNEFAVNLLRKQLGLDLGESESIVLAQELESEVLLIDESKGRKIAKSLNISIAGTVGMLIVAKNRGFIDKVSPLLDDLIKHKIRISQNLYEEVLKKANEWKKSLD